jgi:glycosyltransferase involved in cell wall biosynthesis
MMIDICMITYNHEAYIREAIEGVLMQKSNFSYRLIIGEDLSSDTTRQICNEYALNYPDKIKLLPSDKNLGVISNFVRTLNNSSAKYIALLDGDDYWTDPLKLQKQVDFLENNEDYNICFHDVKIFNQQENSFKEDYITPKSSKTDFDISDLVKRNIMHTPSVMLRNNFEIPRWFSKAFLGDWTLYVLAIKDKKIKKIEGEMAVYRVHETSVWSSKSSYYQLLKINKTLKVVLKNCNKLDSESILTLKNRIKNTNKLIFNNKVQNLRRNYSIIDNLFILKSKLK